MKSILIYGLILFTVFAGGIYVGTSYNDSIRSLFMSEPVNPQTLRQEYIVSQGRLVPFNRISNITAPPGQKVEKYLIDVDNYLNQPVTVKKDQEIAILSGHKLLLQQKDLAQAQLKDATIELQAAVDSATSAKIAADMAVKEAELKLKQINENQDQQLNQRKIDNAQKKLDQIKQLLVNEKTRELISQQDVVDREIDLAQAQDDFDKATLQLENAREAAEFALESAKKNQTLAADALLRAKNAKDNPPESLTTAVEVANTQLELAKVLAPADGTVLKVFVKPGESAVNTPLVQTGNLNQMQCIAEVADRMVNQIQIGDRVTISSPAFSDPENSGETTVQGTVESIGRIVGDSNLPSPNPLALVDKKTVDVTITIDESDTEIARRFVNLQVSVKIESKNAQSTSQQQ
jgi:HlyD family secretion protein